MTYLKPVSSDKDSGPKITTPSKLHTVTLTVQAAGEKIAFPTWGSAALFKSTVWLADCSTCDGPPVSCVKGAGAFPCSHCQLLMGGVAVFNRDLYNVDLPYMSLKKRRHSLRDLLQHMHPFLSLAFSYFGFPFFMPL